MPRSHLERPRAVGRVQELKATFEAMLRVVLTLHAHGYAHCALQPESFRLYGGTGWRLATLDSLTRFGQPTSTKCPVCYAAPEVVRYLRRPAGVAAGTPVKTAPAVYFRRGSTRGSSAATPLNGQRSILSSRKSEAQDVWSLGLLLWQLFSQQPLIGSEAEALTMLPSMRSVEPSLGCVTDAQARHLLQKMLQQDESERITPQKILKHGYLTGGLDTVQLESTFGPMQKGQLFVRSLLQAVAEGLGEKRPKARHAR
jgi:serine/threonine protein kinase